MEKELWVKKCNEIFEGTNYEALVNPAKSETGITIRVIGTEKPHLIGLWPESKGRNGNSVIFTNIINSYILDRCPQLAEFKHETPKNRSEYRKLSDTQIIEICEILAKRT